MKSCFVNHYSARMQRGMYESFNHFSNSYPITGRLCLGPFVCGADLLIEVIKQPARSFEFSALIIVNIFGKVFSPRCTIKDGLFHVQASLTDLFSTPVAVVILPLKFLYQLFAIMIYAGGDLQSINFNPGFANFGNNILY